MRILALNRFLAMCVLSLPVLHATAWDYEAHRAINQAALATLPKDFPDFVRSAAAVERIGFLAGEPDRWRNTPDLPLKHFNGPDHYMDVEEIFTYGLKPEQLPVFRYDFVAQLALARAAHPDQFPAPSTAKNEDHTRELIGLLPWGMVEMYGKLKSGFSYLKAYQEHGGTEQEIKNAEENIIYIMGVMGHLYGDSSQPLHTTKHHHGWVGENPNGYSTAYSIHSWIDGGFFGKTGGVNPAELSKKLRPAALVRLGNRAAKPDEMFQAVMLFIVEQNKMVEPLYRLDKEGKLSTNPEANKPGRDFLEKQLATGAQLLADTWYSSWQQAPPDSFLIGQLASRKKN